GSFILALGSFGLSAATVMARPTRLYRALSGVVSLAGVTGMHFLGISGLRLAGGISWEPASVAIAIGGSLAIVLANGAFVYRPTPVRRLLTALGGTLAIAFLHLTAMSAMVITP